MREYDEYPEPSSIDYSIYQMEKEEYENKIEKLERQVEDLECEKEDLIEDITYIRSRNSYFRKNTRDLVKVFLDNANNEAQTSDDTIARVFEYIHLKGWDHEYIENRKKKN